MPKDKDRRIAANRSETINHHNGQLHRKIPNVTRLENCIMEINNVRGIISVAHQGRIKLKVSRIPLRKLRLPTITVIAAPEVLNKSQ